MSEERKKMLANLAASRKVPVEDESSESESEVEEVPKKVSSPSRKLKSIPMKKKAKVEGRKSDSDSDTDESDDGNDSEGIDKSNIIPGGRRTRGVRLDYTKKLAEPYEDAYAEDSSDED